MESLLKGINLSLHPTTRLDTSEYPAVPVAEDLSVGALTTAAKLKDRLLTDDRSYY